MRNLGAIIVDRLQRFASREKPHVLVCRDAKAQAKDDVKFPVEFAKQVEVIYSDTSNWEVTHIECPE